MAVRKSYPVQQAITNVGFKDCRKFWTSWWRSPTGRSYEHASPPNLGCSPIFSLLLCAIMQVTQGFDPTIFPQFARLAANLACAERLLYGRLDALANGVIRM